jgi:catechol 2,3-dioxygenase-like lactoylglutathione lyase family enzyme
VLTDHWDISHICVAVPDLEAAQSMYEKAFGVTGWGPMLEFSDDNMEVSSQILGPNVSMVGLREVWALNGSDAVAGGPPFAPLELAHAELFSPAYSMYGCPDGRQYVHHICYWVDDIEAESTHLMEHDFGLEMTMAPGDVARGFGYHLSPTGMRVELMRREDKGAIAKWLQTGELELDWPTGAF